MNVTNNTNRFVIKENTVIVYYFTKTNNLVCHKQKQNVTKRRYENYLMKSAILNVKLAKY